MTNILWYKPLQIYTQINFVILACTVTRSMLRSITIMHNTNTNVLLPGISEMSTELTSSKTESGSDLLLEIEPDTERLGRGNSPCASYSSK